MSRIITVFGATDAQGGGLAWAQSFAQWLAQNAARMPIEPRVRVPA